MRLVVVSDFHVTDSTQTVGYYAGFVASAFIFCQFLSSSGWGHLSDTYGRRPVLLIGLAGTYPPTHRLTHLSLTTN